MLERIVADRLKALATEHHLLPEEQFGAPGGNTTKALQFLLNPIYASWEAPETVRTPRLKASLLSLDIAGAYDNVERGKVLETLARKNIPDWIIRFVRSFLSFRSTALDLPGHRSPEFWVNTGIPQGSPLSPILFLFFSSPILELERHARIYLLAYVDDTYFLVISRSYRHNCEMMKALHDQLLAWAGPNDVSFSPPKYNVIHFRTPRSRGEDCTECPDIPHLDKETALKTEISILGIVMDNRLNWKAHVATVSDICELPQVSRFIAFYTRGGESLKY